MRIRERAVVQAECEEWGVDQVQTHVDAHPDDPERIYRLEWLNMKLRTISEQVANSGWSIARPDVQQAIGACWAHGMPPMASALYGRWWQLESWLRTLVYVELKAAFGAAWAELLPAQSESRQQGEQEYQYMPTPDAQDRLAYTDASGLSRIIEANWNLFRYALPSRNVWVGRVEELRAIRNRIGHCRRPHSDDLLRLEQTLRDLTNGAFIATSAFNNRSSPDENWTDEVVDSWVRRQHSDAGLIDHAAQQYEVLFELEYSRRPWVASPAGPQTISGVGGYVWHAFWSIGSKRHLDVRRFWDSLKGERDDVLLVCLSDPGTLDVSFPAINNPRAIADMIGRLFNTILLSLDHGSGLDDYLQWSRSYSDIDPMVQVATPWVLVDESMQGVSLFGA